MEWRIYDRDRVVAIDLALKYIEQETKKGLSKLLNWADEPDKAGLYQAQRQA